MESIDNSIRVVIADDEPLARQLLARLVQGEPGVTVVGTANDGNAARRLIEETEPDLVFLDVEMPNMSGVELASGWRSLASRPHVVFVTAYDRYAIKAFELDALDYLVKPIRKQRLSRSLERARKAIFAARIRSPGERIAATTRPGQNGSEPHRHRPYVIVRQRDELIRVPESDIIWLEAASQYVRIHTQAASYIVAEPLSRYHRRLNADTFVRVHRSAVVNVGKVARVLKKQNGIHELRLSNGVGVPLSRSRKNMVHELLGVSAENRLRG